MTRILSELLGAREPFFRQRILQLEQARGLPSADIRLTGEVLQLAQTKLKELNLDPRDTTPQELYHTLQRRLQADDARLEKTLRTVAATHISAEGNVVAGMVHALTNLPFEKNCFSLKPSVLKSLLTKQVPKRAIKQLGYRSAASLLKHESPVNVLAAAWLSESAAWQRTFLERYRQLKPQDFEVRQITVQALTGERWQKLAAAAVAANRHTVLTFKELGTVIILPLPADKPKGSVMATLTLALHGMNDIRSASSYLKLVQVRADFGRLLQEVVVSQPRLNSHMLDQSMPWELVHHYYGRLKQRLQEEVFGPYLESVDISWHNVEDALTRIEPELKFWQQTSHAGFTHNRQPVSLNVLDAALNSCNGFSFDERVAHFGQTALWHELMLRYLNPAALETAVKSTIEPELATEKVLV